ncbi:putative reverse transcriptase domain-containing protein [Tanacetum coccineum]
MTQSCYAVSPSHSLELLKDRWTDYPQEPSTLGISLKSLYPKGPIPGMAPTQASTANQTMANQSQKWHDSSSSRNIDSGSNSEGIAAIGNKLDSLGRDMKKLKENMHAIQVGCQTWGGPHLYKECPLNEEVKSIEEVKCGEFGRSSLFDNGAKYHVGSPGYYTDLGASVNVIPKSMFEHLKLADLKKTDMLVEMADMTRRSPIGIVGNVLVKIDKFLFPSDFIVIDMLETRNEIMILGRPFLTTIHVEIDVFNKEISLGIRDDRVTFDMNKKFIISRIL